MQFWRLSNILDNLDSGRSDFSLPVSINFNESPVHSLLSRDYSVMPYFQQIQPDNFATMEI
jgi:hypothetical protein